ncbi:FecCD family ABC transporter permease [Curtobacterium ammoniigenes]|uniref:FecCD family ABC transporter permease n=1 Tax=Curtobacterium ammoniigenes TaxID=395387 RepID=UPI000835550A|nr:iron ABC transporter permease [Curtobacterium ammoniigenes]
MVAGTVVMIALMLAAACVASLAVGGRSIAPAEVVRVLLHPDDSETALIVVGTRIPRTVLGLIGGAALGVAGVVMQSITRNALADPGVLGVNGGAALAVVLGITIGGVTSPLAQIPLAVAGAAAAGAAVFVIASGRRGKPTPVAIALSGAVIAGALGSATTAVLLSHAAALDALRFWQVGGLSGRGWPVVTATVLPIAFGIAATAALARPLDVLALGSSTAAALGQRVGLARLMGGAVAVLLAGTATAAIGPVAFVGLAVPHLARRAVGARTGPVIAITALGSPVLVLVADVLGRVLAWPGEVPVGVLTAAIGAPVFILIVRSRSAGTL